MYAANYIRAMPENGKPPAMRVDIYCPPFGGKICAAGDVLAARMESSLLSHYDNRTFACARSGAVEVDKVTVAGRTNTKFAVCHLECLR